MNSPVIFRSQNNDIIIEFTKEKVNRTFSFAKTDQEDRYIYTMRFKNNLGVILKSINISDCEMYILLDNICNFIYSGSDSMMISLSCKDTDGQFIIFIIESEYSDITNVSNIMFHKSVKNIFKVFQHFNDSLVSILSFEISNNIVNFANCIYDICIQGLDIITEENNDIISTNLGLLINPKFLL